MEALVHAGGKGTRMGKCGIEKPMMKVGNKCTVERVVEAIENSKHIDRILVSVSDNTLETEKYLKSLGVETIRTSGNDFMSDLHQAMNSMRGKYVLTCPSDLPLITTEILDSVITHFDPNTMDSLLAVVCEETVRNIGITPSYVRRDNGKNWVLSGVSVMDREKVLIGDYLEEALYKINWPEIAVNVNTPHELDLARRYHRE